MTLNLKFNLELLFIIINCLEVSQIVQVLGASLFFTIDLQDLFLALGQIFIFLWFLFSLQCVLSYLRILGQACDRKFNECTRIGLNVAFEYSLIRRAYLVVVTNKHGKQVVRALSNMTCQVELADTNDIIGTVENQLIQVWLICIIF